MYSATSDQQWIRRVDFNLSKYSEHFLIDVGRLESLEGFVRDDAPHTLSFYDITFIQSGSGELCLDGESIILESNTIVFTSPFQVRSWKSLNSLKGIALFFVRDFVNMLFNDRYFLDRFMFFDNSGVISHLKVDSEFFSNIFEILVEMEKEFQTKDIDTNEILASNLYKILASLNRKTRLHNLEAKVFVNPYIHAFKQLLEEKFKEEHQVNFYAQELAITSSHLSDLCKKNLGVNASEIIKDRLVLEAKRLILYTELNIKQIAFALNFSESANFNRFFKNNVGCSPGSYLKYSPKRQFYP